MFSATYLMNMPGMPCEPFSWLSSLSYTDDILVYDLNEDIGNDAKSTRYVE